MSSALRLTDGVDLAIREHGRDAYPHECCGVLIGRDGIVTSTSLSITPRICSVGSPSRITRSGVIAAMPLARAAARSRAAVASSCASARMISATPSHCWF